MPDYHLSFTYVGEKMIICHDEEDNDGILPETASKALSRAEDQIKRANKQLHGLASLMHEYSWPDGTLCKSISCDENSLLTFINYIDVSCPRIVGVDVYRVEYIPVTF